MSRRKHTSATRKPSSSETPNSQLLAAACAAIGWSWAFALIATRQHLILTYGVFASAPPVWGFVALPAWKLIGCFAAGIFLAGLSVRAAGVRGQRDMGGAAIYWMLAAYVVPTLDIARITGVPIPLTFFEPLFLAFITGKVVLETVRLWPRSTCGTPQGNASYWLWGTVLLTALATVWWYLQGQQAYNDYLLGYHDFGHFARRAVNTWDGRGFLIESPGQPAYWDHFNPGLALIAPLWGVWRDERLFILLQAICLASPALIIFGIARAWGARTCAAAAWSAAYLTFPAVGQLNLNYSYGWHPVSLALPLIFLSVWALLAGRHLAAVATAILACSFKETVLVTMACLAAALALQFWFRNRRDLAWISRRLAFRGRPVSNHAICDRAAEPGGDNALDASTAAEGHAPDALLARSLPLLAWVATWVAITIAFFFVVRRMPFTQFQTARFANLGDSSVEIALSPLCRPQAFWGQMLRPQSVLFLLALTVPLGLRAIRRGWLILLAAALPTVVLLAWQHPPATCIAFQYVTTLIPILFLAAISGAASDPGDPRPAQDGLLTCGTSALAACLTASAFLGGMPWSSPTLTIVLARTYEAGDQAVVVNPRAVGTPGNRRLNEVVDKLDRPNVAVLASGRVAAHLVGVRRLESVEQAIVRWGDLCVEAGDGRSGVEVFDWIVLDTYEVYQQSSEKMQFIAEQAGQAGYIESPIREGVRVFGRTRSLTDLTP